MNEKAIKGVLSKKINDLANHIKKEYVKEAFLKDVIIAGGAVMSLLKNEKPNDFDMYFRSKSTAYKVARYFCDRFTERTGISVGVVEDDNGRVRAYIASDGIAGDDPDPDATPEERKSKVSEMLADGEKYIPVFISSNAITLSNDVQLIIRFYGEPDEIIENYDYEHTKMTYDHSKKDLKMPNSSLICAMNKQLIYTGSRYPVCSLFRMRKFLERGWTINAGQIFKMSFQISHLDLEDLHVLEDQLVGVDTTYFKMFLDILHKAKEKEDFKITASYIQKIIDRVFN